MAKRRPSGDGMVRKKSTGKWEGRIVVGHKESGAPIFRYVYAKTQKELLDKLNKQKEIYRDVELNEDSKITLGEWLDRWLNDYMTVKIRASTMVNYRQFAEKYIKPLLGDKIISSITTADIQKMYTKLKKEGRINYHPQHGHQLSDTMLRSIHTMLHGAMKTAQQEHIIPTNPTEKVVVPKKNHAPKRIFTKAELDIFMIEITKDKVWHDFFYTAITTGLRRGEICCLRWEDFDEINSTLSVNRTFTISENSKFIIGDTKTSNSVRKIILPPSTAQILRERKKTSLSEWIFHKPLKPEDPTNPSSAYNKLKQILKNANLPELCFHELRHVFSTYALANGVDAKTLSSILGHTNASFTLDTYTHVTSDMQKQAATIVGTFIEEIMV